MAIKDSRPAGGEKNSKQAELWKLKIRDFFIEYFNHVILLLGVIIFLAGFLTLDYPKYRQITLENETYKNNLLKNYEAKSDYLNSMRNLKNSYESISREEKDKLKSMIPSGGDTSGIIAEIESVVVKNGAILNSVNIETLDAGGKADPRADSAVKKERTAGIFQQPPSGIGLVKIEVSLASVNYPVLKNIIKTLENNLRLFDIARIEFNDGESKAAFIIYSYYLRK